MIGVFGGTFDPVHYGHIKPALHVKQALGLEQLRFIPNRIPPHRQKPWLDEQQRLALLRTALAGYEDVVVDERELERSGPSYMVDTLASLHDDFPEKQLYLIIGMDAFLDIHHWHQWQRLFDYCHLVVTQRPGYDFEHCLDGFPTDVAMFLKDRIRRENSPEGNESCGEILLQSVPQLDISSTEIRQKLMEGKAVDDLMPAAAIQQLRGYMNG